MIVQCPACSSRYRVNASNIPQTGGKIRCPSCQHAFVVYPEAPAQAPAPTPSSYDEDKTSIASRPDLQQLLHNFQQGQQGGGGGGGQEDAGATEIMSGDALPNFANMFGGGGGGGGAQAQNNAHEGDDGTVEMQNPLAFIQQWEKGQGGSLPEDEEDATQIASPDFDFNTFQPLQAPANPAPARPASPPPSKPAPNPFTAQPASQQQQPAASPFKPGAFGDDPFSAVATQESPSPFANGANPLAAQGMGGAPAAAPAPVDGPDPNHQGPWKLKTNFGLTYEFVDTQNLLQWMASRDELDGYMLSGHNDQFYPVKDFPQISQGLAAGGRTRTSRPANMSTGPIPQVPVGAAPPAFGAGQPAAQGGFGQPMGQGGFGAPPQQPAQRGERVQSGNFQPPSRDAAWNKVLWVVFILLFIGAVGIGLQLSGVVDIKGMVMGTPPAPTTPVTTPTPTPTPEVKPTTTDEPVIEASEGEVEALIKDAKRAIKNNKFISAKEKLQAAKLLAPERPEIYEMLAQVYDEMKQPEEAKAAREKAAALSGKAPEEGGEAKPPEDGAPEEGDKGSEPPSE